jgi:hypothetical protein
MVDKNPYRERTKKELIKAIAVSSAAVLVILLSVTILNSQFGRLGMFLWLTAVLITVGGVLIVLVRWHARNTAYRCPACLHEFEISALRDFISPHGFGRKYLKCPACGKRSWALALAKESSKQ